MAQYQVPQFIEVEDKIFGPLTFKQFLYLAGGGGLCLLFFTLLPLYFAFLVSLPVVALSLGLAFYKVNNRPLIVVIEHGVKYFFGSKLYLWKPRTAPNTGSAAATTAEPLKRVALIVPKLSEGKLKDLSWSLNIKDRAKMGIADTAARTGFEI